MHSKALIEENPRLCKTCKECKPLEEFYEFVEKRPDRAGGVPKTYRMHECSKCYSKRKMNQYNTYKDTKPWHQEKRLSYLKKKHDKYREIVFDHFGKLCACCAEDEEGFLEVDHIEPVGGEKNRAKLNQTDIYRWLVKNNFPDGFRILCSNCNKGRTRTIDGECPHTHQSSSQTRARARSHKCGETPDTQMGNDIVETAMKIADVNIIPTWNEFDWFGLTN